MSIKIGKICGMYLHLAPDTQPPRHMEHKIVDGKLVYVSTFQNKYRGGNAHEVFYNCFIGNSFFVGRSMRPVD